VGEFRGEWLFQLSNRHSATIVSADYNRRELIPLLRTQAGRAAFASRTGQVAVVGRTRIELWDLGTRALVRHFPLLDVGLRGAYGHSANLGFDGEVVWMYIYDPPSGGHPALFAHGHSCQYDVYDAVSGRHLRSLADATGTWKALGQNCRVRALLGRQDGQVLAIGVSGPDQASATLFDRAP